MRYVLNPEKSLSVTDAGELIEHSPLVIKHNIRARTLKGFCRAFDDNEKFRLVRRKDSVKVYHTILSFGGDDRAHIDDKLLQDIVKNFFSLRGPNNLYLACIHRDKSHIHAHILVSGISLSGRSSRLSKQQFKALKIALQTYQHQKYPDLTHSSVDHDKRPIRSKEEIIKSVKCNRQKIKSELIDCVESAYEKSVSRAEFLSMLAKDGHVPYYRVGKLQGIKYQGKIKFRLTMLGYSAEKINEIQKAKAALAKLNELRVARKQHRVKELVTTSEEPAVMSTKEEKSVEKLDELKQMRDGGRLKERDVDDELERTPFDC